jgi:hypothetical protein
MYLFAVEVTNPSDDRKARGHVIVCKEGTIVIIAESHISPGPVDAEGLCLSDVDGMAVTQP